MTVRRGGEESRSEYEGGGVMPNTVFPKGTNALNNSDRLRLMSLTGQEEDSHAPRDPFFWYGGQAPAIITPGLTEEQKLRDPDRYKETPPSAELRDAVGPSST